MAVYNPFAIPSADNSPYLPSLGGVGGAYDALRGGAQPGLVGASTNLINAGQAQLAPGEFDPTVASLLNTSQNPVNNEVEDYFRNKYMADANSRVAARGLIGQGAGEGLLNEAEKNYSFGRADTGLGRQIAAGQGANALRTGQTARAATLTSAGLGPYDTLAKLLTGTGTAYGEAAGLGNQTSISNARNQAYGNVNAFNQTLNPLMNLIGGIGAYGTGAYDRAMGPSQDYGAGVRDAGLTSDTSVSSGGGGGGGDSGGWGGTDTSGTFWDAAGGKVPGTGAYDHVKAILTPKEFVVRRPVAVKARGALERLNAGDFGGAARQLAQTASVAR